MSKIYKGIILSLDSLRELLIFTFSKDTSVYDKEIAEIIFSDTKNKKILMDALNNNTTDNSIEIKIISGNKLEIVK